MSLICREFGIDNYLKVKIDGTDTFQGRLVKGPKTNQYGRLVWTLPSTFQLPASSIRDLLIPQMEVRFSPPEKVTNKTLKKVTRKNLVQLKTHPPNSSELMELMEPTLNLLDLKISFTWTGLMGGVQPLVVNVINILKIASVVCGCREMSGDVSIYPLYPLIKQQLGCRILE